MYIQMNDYKHSHTDARWLQFFSIMGIPNEKSTLEALNNYQGYDVVVREMISKEIDRQYSFMKWNIVVQTFLFGAITQLKNDKYLWVIIVIGLLASISSFITYWASEAKIKRILYFWDGYRKFKGLSYFAFPPVWTNPTEDVIQVSDLDLGRHSVCFKSSQPLIVFNDLHDQIFRFCSRYFSDDCHDFYYDCPYLFDNSQLMHS